MNVAPCWIRPSRGEGVGGDVNICTDGYLTLRPRIGGFLDHLMSVALEKRWALRSKRGKATETGEDS